MAFSREVASEQISRTALEMPGGYLAELPVYKRLSEADFISPEEEARLRKEPLRFPQTVDRSEDRLTALGFAADSGFSFYSSAPETQCVKSSSSFGFSFLGKSFVFGRKFELDRSCQIAGLAREAAELSMVGFTGGKGGVGGVTEPVREKSLTLDSHSAPPARDQSSISSLIGSEGARPGVSDLVERLHKVENRSAMALDLVRLSADTAVVSLAYDQALKEMTNKPSACLIESEALKRNLMQCDI
ncbi:MAG: hypothetical protein K2Y32_15280 [Candidatus Obscuribacterales bacterium]|nr:hypothetical protein [Candidatus Obscuribacterales bacterium]